MKWTRVCLFSLIVLSVLVVSVLGDVTHQVDKWSGEMVMPLDPEVPDGLVGDFQNSYAWCMAEKDGFLYVGTVRNYLAQILGAIPDDMLAGLYLDGDDDRARIFRKPMDGSAGWELVYESPLVMVQGEEVVLDTGYRAFEIYQGDLYAVSYPFGTSPYSRVLRFDEEDLALFVDVDTTPLHSQEVLRVPNRTGSGLRYLLSFPDGASLFIGIDSADFDGLGGIAEIPEGLETEVSIFTVEGIPLQQEPVSGDTNLFAVEGWTPVGEPSDFPGVGFFPGWSGVWDMIWYNGEMLVSIADPVNGFQLFAGNCIIYPRQYPAGMGNVENAAASPVLFKGQIYLGTFSNWKPLMELFLAEPQEIPGRLLSILTHWTPPQIYRFDDLGTWEMVVGDPGASSPLFTERAGNARAGFYQWPWPSLTGVDLEFLLGDAVGLDVSLGDKFNFSFQRYIWRMTVHQDRLYATTMDGRSLLVWFGNALGQMVGVDALSQVMQVLDLVNDDPAGFDLFYAEDGANWQNITRDGGFGEVYGTSGPVCGNPYNYGGRTLVSSEEGLFVGTANPFRGCQVFRLEPYFQDSISSGEGWKMIVTTCPEEEQQASGELVEVESVDGFDVSSADRVFCLDVDETACRVRLYLYLDECPGPDSLFLLQGGVWTELVGVLDPETYGPYYLKGQPFPCRVLFEFDRGTDPSAVGMADLTFAFSQTIPVEAEDLDGESGGSQWARSSVGCDGLGVSGVIGLAIVLGLTAFRK